MEVAGMNEIDNALEIIQREKISDEANWIDGYIENAVQGLYKELEYVKLNIDKSKTVLEYGSAPFVFTKALYLAGYKVVGTDIAPERFKNFCKLNLDVRKVNYDNESLPVESESIDEIICNEVFEHMRGNLIKTFEEAHRVLKKGGKIHVATPNVRSIKGIYMFLFKSKSCSCACDLYHEWNKIETIGHMGHVREYTAQEVKEFMLQIGFNFNSVDFTGSSKGGYKTKIFNLFEIFFPSLRPSMRLVFEK